MGTQAFAHILIKPEQFLCVPLVKAFATSHPALLQPKEEVLQIHDSL